MADQIILEFIGDPSGLKPAEEALKALSKVSEETIEAFNKANEAAKKFAEGLDQSNKKAKEGGGAAKSLSQAVKGIGEEAEKSLKFFAALTAAIVGGNMKEAIKDAMELGSKTKELQEKTETLTTSMTKNAGALHAAEGENKLLKASYEEYKKQVSDSTDALGKSKSAVDATSAANTKLQKSISANTDKINSNKKALAEDIEAQGKFKARIEEVSKTLDADQKTLENNNKALKANEAQTNKLAERKKYYEAILKEARKAMEDSDASYDKNTRKIGENESKMVHLEGEIRKLMTLEGDQSKGIQKNIDEIARLAAANAGLAASAQKDKEAQEAHYQTMAKAKTVIEENTVSITKLKGEHAGLSAGQHQTADAIKKGTAELNTNKAGYDSVSASITKLTAENDKLKAANEAKSKTMADNISLIVAEKLKQEELATAIESGTQGMKSNQASVEADKKSIATLNELLEKEKLDLIDVAKEQAKATLEAGNHYRALGLTIEKLEHLKSISSAATSGMKLFGVENAKVAAVMEKLNQVIELTKAVQAAMNAVSQLSTIAEKEKAAAEMIGTNATVGSTLARVGNTIATAAQTAATWAATAASAALNLAMGPLGLILLAVGAAIGLVMSHLTFFKAIGERVSEGVHELTSKFKIVGDVVSVLTEKFNMAANILRNFLSLFGLMDDVQTHKLNESLKETVKLSDEAAQNAKKQADELEAQGNAGAEVVKQRKEQLEAEKASLDAQLKLAQNDKDEAKQKELIARIQENKLALMKNEVEATKANLEAEKAGADTVLAHAKEGTKEWLKAKEDAIKAAAALEIEEARGNAEKIKLIEANRDKEIHETRKSFFQSAAGDALQSAKLTADLKLELVKKGGQEELNARIADLTAAMNLELSNEKLSGEQRALIRKKFDEEIGKARQDAKGKEINDEKAGIEAQMLLVKAGSDKELQLKKDMLANERKMVENTTFETKNQKEKALAEVTARELALDRSTQQSKMQAAFNTAKAIEQMELLAVRDSELKKIAIEKDFLKKEYDMEIANIKASGKSEEEMSAQVALAKEKFESAWREKDKASSKLVIDEKLKDELFAIEKEKDALEGKKGKEKELLEVNLKGIKARKDANDAALKAGLISDKEHMKQEYEITKEGIKLTEDAKKASAKKQEDMLKEMAKAAIDIGKQVSDALFDNAKQKRDNELQDRMDTLGKQKEHELKNSHLTAAQKKAIEEKFRRLEAKEKEKAWKADQKAKAEQALINGALAFTMSLAQSGFPAGLITGAIALATAGVQAALILTKTPPKFAKGVIGLQGPGTETSDSIAAYLSRGESVITARATRKYGPLLEAINADQPLPMLSTFPRLPDVSKHLDTAKAPAAAAGTEIDYEKLGMAVAKALPKNKVHQISFDKKGFAQYLINGQSRVESYNNRYAE